MKKSIGDLVQEGLDLAKNGADGVYDTVKDTIQSFRGLTRKRFLGPLAVVGVLSGSAVACAAFTGNSNVTIDPEADGGGDGSPVVVDPADATVVSEAPDGSIPLDGGFLQPDGRVVIVDSGIDVKVPPADSGIDTGVDSGTELGTVGKIRYVSMPDGYKVCVRNDLIDCEPPPLSSPSTGNMETTVKAHSPLDGQKVELWRAEGDKTSCVEVTAASDVTVLPVVKMWCSPVFSPKGPTYAQFATRYKLDPSPVIPIMISNSFDAKGRGTLCFKAPGTCLGGANQAELTVTAIP